MSTSTGQWRIQLLGGLTASLGETRLTRFATYKTGALFAYLAYFTPQAHSREVLLELFWPDAAPSAARNSLSAALSALRRQCEPPGTSAGSFVQADRQTIRLNPEAFVTDVAAFETAAQAALAQPDAAALESAVMQYHGPLLPDLYEDWVGTERERLADLHLSLLNTLIQRLADSQDFERALTYAHRAVQADPLREASHRTLMRLHAATGRPAAALEHFRLLEQSLRQTLGVAPSRATQELVREVAGKLGRPSQPPSVDASPVAQPGTEVVGDLPQRLTRFFGRESDRTRLGELLRDPEVRLVTLTGPGGIGKSRLSLEVAQDLRGAFQQRVWFIPLSDITEAGPLRDAVRDGLRLPRGAGIDPQSQIVAALAAKPSLLVLDNFEQLVAAGAPILRGLLEQIPGLTCLVSSRQTLEIAGEREWPISSLSMPPEGADYEGVVVSPAVRLFADRAQARHADFGITPGNFEAVAALCRKLEGIPLAIELAADWARMLTPAQMLARLTHRFDLLVSRRPDLPARHQSLRAVLDSSVTLLPESLQRFFARLSVFRGGWTLEAAETVCADDRTAADCFDDLRRLQERSLIVAEEAGETMRYRMLETLREYAAEQMTPGESRGTAQRHAEFFQKLAVDSRPILGGPDPSAWMDRLELERANLRAALDWALQNDSRMALDIPEALWRFWEIRGHRPEGKLWLEEALRASAEDPREEIVLQRAHALNILGQLNVGLGRYEEARVAYEEGLAVFRQAGDTRCIASILNNMGVAALNQDDYAAARPLLEETLTLKRDIGNERSLASTLSNLGQAAEGLGERTEARAYYRQSLDLARKFSLNWGIAHLLANLADLALQEDDLAESLSLHRQSLLISQELGDKQNVAERLMTISSLIFRSHGPVETSVRLSAAASVLLSETGGVLRPNVQEKCDLQHAEMRAALGDVTYDAQWQAGSVLTLTDAAAEALAPLSAP